jgi:hypothetical protein
VNSSPPADPVGQAVANALAEMLFGASVELTVTPHGATPAAPRPRGGIASANDGHITITIRLGGDEAELVRSGEGASLAELLEVLPAAGVRVAARLRGEGSAPAPESEAPPALRRAVRDMLAADVVTTYLGSQLNGVIAEPDLVAETIEYLVELSGTRVEAQDLTHGVVITDVLHDEPRLQLRYPEGLRSVKRAPLLFDGRRSVLVVDRFGRARTEVQRHRFDRLAPRAAAGTRSGTWRESGSLVAEATAALGGIGFFLRADRTIWTYAGGQPLLVRRSEHWTAFPLELTAAIASMIDGGGAAELVARAAFTISAQPHGAILAIVSDRGKIDGVVPAKDRFDLRSDIPVEAIRPETWLHHLIDVGELDIETLSRLATLDGATVVDREGELLAYGAIVTSADSEHEGARTAAARTLSEVADVVLKVSVDGDITIFRAGAAVTTLLGHPATNLRQ